MIGYYVHHHGHGHLTRARCIAEATDQLVVNGLASDDVIDASGVTAGSIGLQLLGGDGNDLIIGGAGDDLIVGGRGNDVALMGAGNDRFTWAPGDGSDIVEGQGGFDTLGFDDFKAQFERFERVIEVVSREDEDRALARARFKLYRDSGLQPQVHEAAE